jgi:hypothetical protein
MQNINRYNDMNTKPKRKILMHDNHQVMNREIKNHLAEGWKTVGGMQVISKSKKSLLLAQELTQ